MVLRYARFVLTVEAKTRSAEHRTPSGEPQSEAYPNAVRRKFGLPASFPVFMVFLTMDGTLPANQDAISTTYLNFAAALAAALAGAALPEELRFVFRLWISHLATCAVPGDLDVRHVVGQLISLFDEPRHEEMDGKILAALDDINSLLTLLPVRTEHE
jgi:hypothetical protein